MRILCSRSPSTWYSAIIGSPYLLRWPATWKLSWLPDFKTFPEEEISLDGVTVRRFPICYNVRRRRATRLLGLVPYWRWKSQYWTPSFRIPGLPEALQSVDADLFHIGPLPYSNLMYAGLRAAEWHGVPAIATPCTHLGEEGNDEVSRHYLRPYQIELLNRCAKVFCMTKTEMTHLEHYGVIAEKMVTGYGIDLQMAMAEATPNYLREKYQVDGPVVLHLGMKAHEKGTQTLVEAMKILWSKGSNAWLVMAGAILYAFVDWVGAAAPNCPRFLNLPPFADTEKRDLLASATVVAQPSRVESLGLVLLEAWANQKPVIAADIAVSRELITDSGGGALVPFGNPQQLAGQIETFLRDPELCQAMGANGQKKAFEYEGSALWRRNAEEFERVVAAGPPSKQR